jgi:glycosyltransferase involved in cell wall biosynthesis
MQSLVVVSHHGETIRKIAGGSDARSVYIFKAIALYLRDVKYLRVCNDKGLRSIYIDKKSSLIEIPVKRFNVHSLNFITRDGVEEIKRTLKILMRMGYEEATIISCDPISLNIFLRAKKSLSGHYDVKVLWSPGGNELTCPLHTEVCPFSKSHTNTYGHQVSPSLFSLRCFPHIIKVKGVNMYHTIIWPLFRREVVKNVDGLLATRSVYIENSKLLGLERCYYIGFGVDTSKFTQRDKINVVKYLLDNREIVDNRLVWGNFDKFAKELLKQYDSPIVVGFIGAARPWWKNVELIVSAFNHIARIFNNVFLLMVGRHMSSLLPLLHSLSSKIRERVIIIDEIPHTYINLFYNLIDVFINPSLLDSLELNTLEALASGNVVLASNRGCISDLKYMGISAPKIFEPTPKSLLNTLGLILKDVDLYKDEVTKELEHVGRKLSLETYGARIVKALEKLCAL